MSEKKRIEMSEVARDLSEWIQSFVESHKGELRVSEISQAAKIAREVSKQEEWFKKRALKAAELHPDPECDMGDVVTVAVAGGKHKGTKITGRFVAYNAKTGRTTILVPGNSTVVRGFFESRER